MEISSFKKVWREYKQALDDYCEQIRKEADRVQEENYSILEELMNAPESKQFNIPTVFQELLISISEIKYISQIWSYMHHQHAVVFIDGPLKDHVHYERMHSMDEIWDSLNEHGVIAATAILQRLRCNEYSDIEKLITLYKSGEKDSFIQQLKSMSCDLSHLYLACEHKPHKADFSQKTDIEDLLVDIDYYSVYLFDEEDPLQELINSFYESVKKWLPQLMSLLDASISETDKTQIINDSLDNKIMVIADTMKVLLKNMIDNTKWMFGFEKEVFSKSIQHPSIQFLLEYEGKDNSAGVITTNVPPEEQEQPVNVLPEMTETKVQKEVGLHWPTDEELKGYKDNYNGKEYFTNTIFGPAGKVKASVIKELYRVLSGESILKEDIETQLIFLARYTGKEIPGLTLRPIEWHMLDSDRDGAIGYLIYMTTTKHEFVKGECFFYFDYNGVKKTPDSRQIGQIGSRWAQRPENSTARTRFETALNKFLQEYQSSSEG